MVFLTVHYNHYRTEILIVVVCTVYVSIRHFSMRSFWSCWLLSYTFSLTTCLRLHYDWAGGEGVEEVGVLSGARQEVSATAPAKASQRAAAGSGELDRRLIHTCIHSYIQYIYCNALTLCDGTLILSYQPSGCGSILCHGEEWFEGGNLGGSITSARWSYNYLCTYTIIHMRDGWIDARCQLMECEREKISKLSALCDLTGHGRLLLPTYMMYVCM